MKFSHAWGCRGAAILAMLLALLPHAGGAPENTVVVVNGDSWASTYIANEYVKARGIPPWNVVYLYDLPSFDRLPVEDFRQKILLPVLQTMDARGLQIQIDAVLYSADFPTMIDLTTDIGTEKISPALTPYGAITGLTYLYQAVQTKTTATLDLGSNFYMRRASLPVEDAPWSNEERATYLRMTGQVQEAGRQSAALRAHPDPAGAEAMRKKLQETIETMEKLREKHPQAAELAYNMGCTYALLGRPDDALKSLQRAADSGWWEIRNAVGDEDLVSLRGRPDFEKFLARTRETKFDPQPAMGFRGAIGWLQSGAPVPPEKGRRYLISTMLAYTSGRGNSVREALASLRRSASADSTMPKGTVYYMKNGDVRSVTREWGFDAAVEKLKALGVKAVVESGVLPEGKSDVAGVTVGSAGFDWAASKSRILPGAICEHLTSCGGMLHEGDGQTPLTEFIRHGAAGASGAVTEPFAIQAKFPTPFIHSFYAQGSTLGEAFYQSLSGPYQLLIVGDALCKPWGRRLIVKTDDLQPGATLKGPVKIAPKATSPDHIEAAIFELYIDGKRALIAKNGTAFNWDTRTVPDGAHDITIVASASDLVASQGRLVVPVEIRNSDQTLKATAPGARERAWDKPIEVTASLPGAKEIVVMANVRPVGRIPGDSGSVSIDPRVLGQGPVRLMTVAVREGAGPRQVVAKPIDLTIVPPAPLRALTLPAGQKLADDFAVRVGDDAPRTAKGTDGAWIGKAGADKETETAIEGWFSVPEDDVYQFQLHGNANLKALTVDGVPQSWPHGKEWWFVPVNLSKGLHRLNISTMQAGQAALEIRFGGTGTQRLDGVRFKHLAR